MFSKTTSREISAIKVMRDFLMKHGRMPSVRDLMRELDYKSPRSASVILESLLSKGVLKKRRDGGVQLIQYEIKEDNYIRAQTVKISLLGTVACGVPIFAEENIEAEISVSIKLVKPSHKYFLLKASGDSMNKKGINDGDLVLIRQQQTANNGDIVVALIDDEATIKEYHHNVNTIVLKSQSTNNKHQPIILTHDFRIQGVVEAVIPM